MAGIAARAASPAALRFEQAVATFLPPGKRLRLTVTDNRCNMVTVRRQSDGYLVRAHRMFLAAGTRIVRALARYIVHNDPRASRTLGEYIQTNEAAVRRAPRRTRQVTLRPRGQHHDLQAIFDRLNRQRFGGLLDARITWGPRRGHPGGQRSIKMGSFAIEERLIRIHPVLDDPRVPEYFLGWIVFHEMLHGKHGAEERGGRRCYHTRAFLEEERSYEHYARAQAWEEAHMPALLRSARADD